MGVQAGGAGQDPDTRLADHLQRRRDEVERLLAAGKLLIVFTRPNVPHSHVLGQPGYDRYSWLPAPPNVIYRPPHLIAADGRGVTLEDATHPFAALVDRFQNWFTYRAAFSERMPDFPTYGRVLMRSRGGVPVGVELKVGPGRILFLPALLALGCTTAEAPSPAAAGGARPHAQITTSETFDSKNVPPYTGAHDAAYAYIDANIRAEALGLEEHLRLSAAFGEGS